jgi:hypothetical protein
MKVKVLSVKQPYAWLLVHGLKDIENRSWPTNYRGPLLIHASKKDDPNPDLFGIEVPDDLHRGGIVGAVVISGCVETSSSRWFCGPIGWTVTDSLVLPFQPMRGSLGLMPPPPDVLKNLDAVPAWRNLMAHYGTEQLCFA